MVTIDSNYIIPTEEIEQSFKVLAGPGAGKTYWLIKHIKNVLRSSKRLTFTTQIACITYTNIGADEIQRRLDGNADNVYVSTIHNFLYKFIVKPYVFLLKDADGKCIVNLKALDGHDEHIPSANKIGKWVRNNYSKCSYLSDKQQIANLHHILQKMTWNIRDDGNLFLKIKNKNRFLGIKFTSRTGKKFPFPLNEVKNQNLYVAYKKLYWATGQIHHDDVLYFSYRILTEHPEIKEFISLLFPYLFIDEFQDTSPLQTSIVKMLASSGSVVGVIGDAEQSIYKFQGATRQEFINFELDGLQTYCIKGNRRSTQAIISVLNRIRNDEIEQPCMRGIAGHLPKIYIGNREEVVSSLQEHMPNISILTRNNETVGQIKNKNGKVVANLWSESRALDSSYERQALIYKAIYATELCLLKRYKEAVRLISKLFYKYSDETRICNQKKEEFSIALINKLLDDRPSNLSKSVLEFHNALRDYILNEHDVKIGSAIKSGKFKAFSTEKTYSDLVQSLRMKDDDSNVKTIHKAKGAEYDNVLIVLAKKELKYIVDSQKYQDEDDSRVYYVAFSRAKDNLSLQVSEELSIEETRSLQEIGFNCILFNSSQ